MDCQETQKFVHVYVDGEFAEPDRIEFERHLRECAECRAVARFEERFKGALKSRISVPEAPPELFEAVRSRLEAEPEPAAASLEHRGRRLVIAGVGAGAAAVAVALLAIVYWPTGKEVGGAVESASPQKPLKATVSPHERKLPMEVARQPDRAAAEMWRRDRLEVPVRAPTLRRVRASQAGGMFVDFNPTLTVGTPAWHVPDPLYFMITRGYGSGVAPRRDMVRGLRRKLDRGE